MPARKKEQPTLDGLKRGAARRANEKGHRLRPWGNINEAVSMTTCWFCDADVLVSVQANLQDEYSWGPCIFVTCDRWQKMAKGERPKPELVQPEPEPEPEPGEKLWFVTVPGLDDQLNPTTMKLIRQSFNAAQAAELYASQLMGLGYQNVDVRPIDMQELLAT